MCYEIVTILLLLYDDSCVFSSSMTNTSQAPMSPEEKVELLLEALESLRSTLDEAISYIDDSMIEVDDRG